MSWQLLLFALPEEFGNICDNFEEAAKSFKRKVGTCQMWYPRNLFPRQILKQSFVESVRNNIIDIHARGHIIDGKHWKYVQQTSQAEMHTAYSIMRHLTPLLSPTFAGQSQTICQID
jgi:hypothetical protein